MKYTLVIVIMTIQIFVSTYAWTNFNRTQSLQKVAEGIKNNEVFTKNGKIQIATAFSCLSADAHRFFLLPVDNLGVQDNKYIYIIDRIMNTFPIHFLGTRVDMNFTKIDMLFNTPHPVIITFVVTSENGKYKIEEIKNINELCENINLYFDNVRKIGNGKI